jgi:hypothetical protein
LDMRHALWKSSSTIEEVFLYLKFFVCPTLPQIRAANIHCMRLFFWAHQPPETSLVSHTLRKRLPVFGLEGCGKPGRLSTTKTLVLAANGPKKGAYVWASLMTAGQKRSVKTACTMCRKCCPNSKNPSCSRKNSCAPFVFNSVI